MCPENKPGRHNSVGAFRKMSDLGNKHRNVKNKYYEIKGCSAMVSLTVPFQKPAIARNTDVI